MRNVLRHLNWIQLVQIYRGLFKQPLACIHASVAVQLQTKRFRCLTFSSEEKLLIIFFDVVVCEL